MPDSTTTSDLCLVRGWRTGPELLPVVRPLFEFDPGDDRATGALLGDRPWPAPLSDLGPALVDELDQLLGVRFPIVAFQAYRNGSGCDWHADDPFDAQAILSLGVTRTFGTRPNGGVPTWLQVSHGDLVFMPSGFQQTHQHCVPVEDVPGERISLVFRTPRS